MGKDTEIIILERPQADNPFWRQRRFTLDASQKMQITDEGIIVPTKERGDQFADLEQLFRPYDLIRDFGVVPPTRRGLKLLRRN